MSTFPAEGPQHDRVGHLEDELLGTTLRRLPRVRVCIHLLLVRLDRFTKRLRLLLLTARRFHLHPTRSATALAAAGGVRAGSEA